MYKKSILFWLMMVFFLSGQVFCEEIFDLRAIKADVEIVGTYDSVGLGSVVAAGDMNGDGMDDIVATERCGGGRLYIIYGDTALAGNFDLALSYADVTIEGVGSEQWREKPMISFGDINGDGIEDLLIGSECAGAAYVILGNVSLPPAIDETYPDMLIVGGFDVSAINSGDFNGDGFDDIMISHSEYAWVEVYVWFGAENLPKYFPPEDLHILAIGHVFGPNTSAGCTDFNGDGFDDIFFSNTKYLRLGDEDYSGTVWGIYGDTILPAWINLDSTAADIDIFQRGYEYFGMSLGAGNVNGDGFNDLIIGNIDGEAYVFYGDSLLPAVVNLADTSSDVTIFDLYSFGPTVATGDFNSDGHSDMLLGYGTFGGEDLFRKAYLIFGNESLPGEIHLSSGFDGTTIIEEENYTGLGCSADMGDFNGDGFDDLLIGASGIAQTYNYPKRGKVYVIFGDSVVHRGDPNYDKVVDIGDVVYTLNYLFKSGAAPYPKLAGDANCDQIVDIGDVVFLINYLFKSGPAPSC